MKPFINIVGRFASAKNEGFHPIQVQISPCLVARDISICMLTKSFIFDTCKPRKKKTWRYLHLYANERLHF
ncbi:hypothetical protein VN97_g28 [Penicillium thymicola]|uniref:Uncharacterized protein n=1 Tax=Penicillium thymicola TaxID=293382 RepID=A0AAI9XDK5_PENTH|nr:hypothetical protein VN97_g28 [Penicillium thymicola]